MLHWQYCQQYGAEKLIQDFRGHVKFLSQTTMRNQKYGMPEQWPQASCVRYGHVWTAHTRTSSSWWKHDENSDSNTSHLNVLLDPLISSFNFLTGFRTMLYFWNNATQMQHVSAVASGLLYSYRCKCKIFYCDKSPFSSNCPIHSLVFVV